SPHRRSSRLRLENENCRFFLIIRWSSDVIAIELRYPNGGASAGCGGNLADQLVVIGVFLLKNVDETYLGPSASRSVDTFMSGVIPQVVYAGDILKLRN